MKRLSLFRTLMTMKPSLWMMLTALCMSPEKDHSPGRVSTPWTRRRCSMERRTRSRWSRLTARSSSAHINSITFHSTPRSILSLVKYFNFTLHKVCYVHMILKTFDQDTIDLIPDQIVMASPLALSQYEIKTWQLVYYDPGRSSFFAGNQN